MVSKIKVSVKKLILVFLLASLLNTGVLETTKTKEMKLCCNKTNPTPLFKELCRCNTINSQLDATIIILLINLNFHLILVTSRQLYTTSCKHSLALLRMGEIIARNMLG
jgi:hypothetical protein